KPGGIWRVSVPDLEMACRDYLATLEAATEECTHANAVRYRWAVMAIFEQMVRDRSGGMMLDAVEQGEYEDDQLRHLFGDMLLPLVQRRPPRSEPARPSHSGRQSQSSGVYDVLRWGYRRARALLGTSRPEIVNRLDPRVTKEAVQWMYDRLSLRWLLEQA